MKDNICILSLSDPQQADGVIIFSTQVGRKHDLESLLKALIKFGLWILSCQCQFFRIKLVYKGMNFVFRKGKSCRSQSSNVDNCGMGNFLSFFLKDLHDHLVPAYDKQMKNRKFQWTELCQES